MSDQAAVLQAIESLTEEVRTGFGRINGRLDSVEKRVNGHDREIVRLKTLWAGAAALMGFAASQAKSYFWGQ